MPDDDVKARIRKLLDEALEKHGPSIELTAIEASWGDTLNDQEVIEALQELINSGSAFEHTDEVDDLEEIADEFQKGITRH
jgi:hypothetical protein